jgi:hypothetical protein
MDKIIFCEYCVLINRNGLDKSYVTFCHISLLFIVGEVLRSFLL